MRVNYVVTIFNSQATLGSILDGIVKCHKYDGTIYTVLDGCTDGSEQVVDNRIKTFPNVHFVKLYTPNVHEIGALNAAYTRILSDGVADYNFTVQDDDILDEPDLEDIVDNLYKRFKDRLGYLAFRIGTNIKISDDTVVYENLAENFYHYGSGVPVKPYNLVWRMLAVKSPACVPGFLLEKLGLIDEDLKPHMCDDHDYSLRAMKLGYENLMFPIHIITKIEWGASRRYVSHDTPYLHQRNLKILVNKHGDFIRNYKIPEYMRTGLPYE